MKKNLTLQKYHKRLLIFLDVVVKKFLNFQLELYGDAGL